MRDTGFDKRNVHTVELVGVLTRIPKAQVMLQVVSNGKEPRTPINLA